MKLQPRSKEKVEMKVCIMKRKMLKSTHFEHICELLLKHFNILELLTKQNFVDFSLLNLYYEMSTIPQYACTAASAIVIDWSRCMQGTVRHHLGTCTLLAMRQSSVELSFMTIFGWINQSYSPRAAYVKWNHAQTCLICFSVYSTSYTQCFRLVFWCVATTNFTHIIQGYFTGTWYVDF